MSQLNDETRQQVYEYIRDSIRERHLNPTVREIAKGCYLAPSTVLPYLNFLEGKGWIVREYAIPRSIRLGEQAPDYEE